MKIRKIELENWCQHAKLSVSIENGLTGILGANGKGKSNLIRALVFGLTGFVTGTRTDYLRYGESKGSVALEFYAEEDSHTYRVVRNIHNGDVALYRQNADRFELISDRPATAREYLEELIHVTPDVAQQIFAVPQEDMVALFRETPGKRNEILQRVFSLQFFSRVRVKLRNFLNDADTAAADIQSRTLLLRDQEQSKVAYLASFAALPPAETLSRTMSALSDEITRMSEVLGRSKFKEYLLAQIAQSERSRESTLQQLRAPAPEGTELPEYDVLNSRLTELTKHCENLRTAQNAVEAFLGVPELPEHNGETLQNLRQEIGFLSGKVQSAKSHYDHVVACGTNGTCPTCGAPTTFTEKDLVDAQSAYQSLAQQLEALRKQCREEEVQLAEYNRKHAILDKKRIVAEEALRAAGEFQEVNAVTRDALLERIVQEKATMTSLCADMKSRREWDTERTAWENLQTHASEMLTAIDKNLQTLRSDPALYETCEEPEETVRQKIQDIQEKLAALRQDHTKRIQYDAASQELVNIREELRKLESRLLATQPETRERLRTLQDLFSPKNLPAKVAFSIYKVLAERLNSYLAEFDAPYSVELTEGGDFVCVFNTGLHQPAARLSGGEKMVLSVAFRLALHSVFATDDTGGFIMLDEPTTFLDEKNKDALFRVLNTLKVSPMFRDLQIFVVTHDEMLRPLFNSVIDLS